MNQNQKVLNFLQSGRPLNEGIALGLLKIKALRKIVSNLRRAGHQIQPHTFKNGTTGYKL